MNKSKHSQAGQAVIEMCVCMIAILVVFMGLIFVCGLGISNMQNLIKAKTNAETNTRSSDKSWDSDDIFAWDYRSQQQEQRQTSEPDFFPGSHLFYNGRSGNINPFAASDRGMTGNANAGSAATQNTPPPPVPSDFQSSFLRELSPATQVKKSGSAAGSISRNIPPLFVGAEEVSGGKEPDEAAIPDMIENQGTEEAEHSPQNVKSKSAVKQ
ncbi:MAG: hypothetical protein WCV67_14405 [Victivallaceae bacterium]|jgi:hypothetical protein